MAREADRAPFPQSPVLAAALALLGLAGAAAVPSAHAQIAPSLNASGATGLSVTPTAQLLPWGSASLGYDNEVVGGPLTNRYGTSGHNLVAGFGLLPNLEISGRIASSKFNTNCYTDNCGIRDLSFNFKAGAQLDRDGRWLIAAGGTDVGGETGNFRSLYGVLTYTPIDPLDLTVGYARRGTARNVSTPLDGPFASAAYRPLPWLQTHIEYVDSQAWAGARVYAPSEWLPAGWSAHVGANVRLRGDERTARSWVSIGLNVPLYKVPESRSTAVSTVTTTTTTATVFPSAPAQPAPSTERKAFSQDGLRVSDVPLQPDLSPPNVGPRPPASALLSVAPTASAETRAMVAANAAAASAPPPPAPVTDEQLVALGEALRAKGFEDIRVGRAPDGAVAVRVNNASYNVNTADGLGVALGVIARNLAAQRAGYRLVLMQRQLDIVGVTGQADCLAQWIALGPARCTAGQLYTPGTTAISALLADASWVVDGRSPSWATPRIILQPVLRSAVATEYGVFDHSLALRAMLQQPLWSGAWAEVAGNTPIHDSDDYKQGRVFGNSRFVSQTDRYMVHQMFRLPVEHLFGKDNAETAALWGANALTGHVAAGRIDANYRGTYGEVRWEPGEGRHRLHAEAGRFERIQFYDANLPVHSRTALASYRYAYTPTRTYAEVTAGQFLYNDRGVRFGIKQWFDDVAITLYVRRTKFEWAAASRTSAGIELSIPLTPRRDMSPTYPVQVTGNPRWSYGIETVIREGSNVLSTNQGVGANVSMLDRTFNFDRSGLAYFEDNMPRVRSAARQ